MVFKTGNHPGNVSNFDALTDFLPWYAISQVSWYTLIPKSNVFTMVGPYVISQRFWQARSPWKFRYNNEKFWVDNDASAVTSDGKGCGKGAIM